MPNWKNQGAPGNNEAEPSVENVGGIESVRLEAQMSTKEWANQPIPADISNDKGSQKETG